MQQNNENCDTSIIKKNESKCGKLSRSGLENIWWDDYVLSVNYKKPTEFELELATLLFTRLISSRELSINDNLEWSSLGFSFKEVQEGRYTLGVLSELIPKGHGCYVIKLKKRRARSEQSGFGDDSPSPT